MRCCACAALCASSSARCSQADAGPTAPGSPGASRRCGDSLRALRAPRRSGSARGPPPPTHRRVSGGRGAPARARLRPRIASRPAAILEHFDRRKQPRRKGCQDHTFDAFKVRWGAVRPRPSHSPQTSLQEPEAKDGKPGQRGATRLGGALAASAPCLAMGRGASDGGAWGASESTISGSESSPMQILRIQRAILYSAAGHSTVCCILHRPRGDRIQTVLCQIRSSCCQMWSNPGRPLFELAGSRLSSNFDSFAPMLFIGQFRLDLVSFRPNSAGSHEAKPGRAQFCPTPNEFGLIFPSVALSKGTAFCAAFRGQLV